MLRRNIICVPRHRQRVRLQDASARVAEVEAAAERASRELAEYKAESAELRNQDLTIRRLEERVRGLEGDLQEKARPLKWHMSSLVRPHTHRRLLHC